MARTTLTTPGGPIIVSRRTLAALTAIRRHGLLGRLYGQVHACASDVAAIPALSLAECPWLLTHPDPEMVPLPERVLSLQPPDPDGARAIRLALTLRGSLVLLEGATKEKAKLCHIKSEGALSILVACYREGWLSDVRPMVKALRSLGQGDVLPDDEKLEALWRALDSLG
jgi:hypothetical protein